MKKLTRQDILIIICMVLIFCLLFTTTISWNSYTVQEKDYQSLEKIAYAISENKSIELDISEKLPRYHIIAHENNIHIKLYGDTNECVEADYTLDYELKSLNRDKAYLPIVVVILAYLFVSFVLGAIIGGLIDYLCMVVKKFFIILKGKNSRKK